MFTTLSRAPRRTTAVIGLVGGLVAIMLLIMIKDMNEKLSVMTASNQAYQRMTDQQLDKINKLQVSSEEIYIYMSFRIIPLEQKKIRAIYF